MIVWNKVTFHFELTENSLPKETNLAYRMILKLVETSVVSIGSINTNLPIIPN